MPSLSSRARRGRVGVSCTDEGACRRGCCRGVGRWSIRLIAAKSRRSEPPLVRTSQPAWPRVAAVCLGTDDTSIGRHRALGQSARPLLREMPWPRVGDRRLPVCAAVGPTPHPLTRPASIGSHLGECLDRHAPHGWPASTTSLTSSRSSATARSSPRRSMEWAGPRGRAAVTALVVQLLGDRRRPARGRPRTQMLIPPVQR